ncbi:guanine deaminase [Aurantimonas sp. MSK8Z-1]|uniref:guanine deaminase n=1 Tax=Mangrovibrevibacter kandeliae TaxID=2968473 RepID=UPI0021191EB7|nr:guanine deaminase [Aurantimonas sp. MSK8Z-1]MCW4115540.1 guanine deaminase [Aurantimonas sp. MSK8Z-1]
MSQSGVGASVAIRGRLLWFDGDPTLEGAAALRFVEDGVVVVEGGMITAVGEARDLLGRLRPNLPLADHRPHLVMPGFIDPHLHMPQTQVIGSYGAELMEWLAKYTFPEESRYGDPAVADAASRFLLSELLRSGTTTAAVYCTSHPQSVDSFFAAAERLGLRMIAGKVMMDRNAPAALLDTAERGYSETKALIERWHGRGRLSYAITPRFAPTSSEQQLEAARALASDHPGLHIQTHLSENAAEIAYVREAFPWSKDYTEVYEHYDLVRPKALFGHCIHLSDRERAALAEAGASAIFCPTSNLFLGSGLFDRAGLMEAGAQIGIASDIGGGTSYSMLRTAAEGYKVLALLGQPLDALAAFHMLTAGNAAALGLDDRIGRLAPGYEADLTVLDSRATPAQSWRMERVETLAEELFVLMTMGDDRATVATYAAGRRLYEKGGRSLPGKQEMPVSAPTRGPGEGGEAQ